MFTGISKEICEEAWEGTLPLIQHFADSGRFNKLAGTVVVVDPRNIDRPKGEHLQDVFDDAIIFTGFVGEVHEAGFTTVALSKAFVTWKSGLASAVVQQRHPYLYSEGDTFWGGSTITEGGLVVAFSGVQQVHDEAISEIMASLIVAISRDEVTKDDGVLEGWNADKWSFIGPKPTTEN